MQAGNLWVASTCTGACTLTSIISRVGAYFIENFGCRATQADGAAIERGLQERGLTRASGVHEADVVVLNTCTVTAAADQDARQAIRRIHRERPQARILVTGCYAQRAPQEIGALPGVTWVVGNSHKQQVPEMAAGPLPQLVPASSLAAPGQLAFTMVGDIFAHTELLAAPVFENSQTAGKTRPNLKVQDGCNNRCSFCVIPSVRGRSRSLAPEEVVREVNALVSAGFREVVISGINLGRWGRDLDARNLRFVHLLRRVLAETEIEKLRISSVEPMDWSDELIALVAGSPRIAEHAHVPLQSGSDRVLRHMHRKYRPWHYAERIRRIREAMPDAAIGADVMVGFPGETDELFEESRDFIARLPFTYLHVFTFSARPRTPAATMPGQVPVEVARRRNRVLRDLAAEKNRAFRASFLGRKLAAITLEARAHGCTEALTDNFLPVLLRGEHPRNRLVTAHVDELSATGLVGSVA